MEVVADKRSAAQYADPVIAGKDTDGQQGAMLDLVCRRSGIKSEVLLLDARWRVAESAVKRPR